MMSNLSNLQGKRILVVEDEYLLASDLSKAMQSFGAAVIGPAATVPKAISLLDEGSPLDAAVLDVNLREVLIYPVAQALQKQEVPFLFTTGYDQLLIPEQYRDVFRIRKPYDPAKVVELLVELLR